MSNKINVNDVGDKGSAIPTKRGLSRRIPENGDNNQLGSRGMIPLRSIEDYLLSEKFFHDNPGHSDVFYGRVGLLKEYMKEFFGNTLTPEQYAGVINDMISVLSGKNTFFAFRYRGEDDDELTEDDVVSMRKLPFDVLRNYVSDNLFERVENSYAQGQRYQ